MIPSHARQFPLLFPHRTNIRTFSSPHTTNNIQSFHRQLWRKNCWKTQIWPSNQNIKKHYNTTIDWNGEIFCRIKLKWDYDRKTVDISMPNYVNKALARLHHPPPIKPQHYPHTYNAPIYGHKCQFVIPTITNEKLTPAQLKHCQEFCGFSNYYNRAIDNIMQTDVINVASSHSTSSWKLFLQRPLMPFSTLISPR